MPRLLIVTWKDLRVLLRDVAALGVLLGMPMVLIFILGSALGGLGGEGGSIGAPVAIVNLDSGGVAGSTTDVGTEITAGLVDNEVVAGIFDIQERDSASEVRAEVERGELLAALVIPEDFSQSINDGESISLEVLKDPGSELSANIWESIVRGVAADISRISITAQTAGETAGSAGLTPELIGAAVGMAVDQATAQDSARPIVVEQLIQTQESTVDLQGMDFYALSMTSMFLVFGAMFGAFGFITESRERTLSRMLTTPVSRVEVIGGKMLAIWILGLAQFTVLYVFTRFTFGVQWGDDPLATFVVAGAQLIAVTGLAVLIAAIAKTERGAGGFGSLIVQLMALIGGVFFPITILPEWLRPIRYASIMGWGLEGMSDIQIHGAGLADVTAPIVALVAMGALFFAFGIWRLRVE